MRKLKCIVILFLTAVVLALASGCTNKNENSTKNKQILTSFYPVQIIMMNLTKNVPGIDVTTLTSPETGCLHNYQLTPVDMTKIEKADCMVINGAGMESFLDKILHDKSGLTLINASSDCTILHNEEEGGHDEVETEAKNDDEIEDEDHEHHHSEENPHVWLSPAQYLIQIQAIANGLALWDTVHAGLYRQNSDAYSQEIRTLQYELDTLLKNLPGRDIITFHAAFSYFAREYNLNVRSVIQLEPGQEPSASELVELISIIKQYNIRTVFVEPQYRSKTADVLSRETGVHVDTLDPIVTGPIEPDTYIKAMRKNGMVLYNALKQEVPGNGN